MGFNEFLTSFPIVILVHVMVSTSNGNDIDENNASGDVPDCEHIVKRTDLHFVNEMCQYLEKTAPRMNQVMNH